MTCGECGNVTAPGAGFPNHVYCMRFLLHMEKREDASRCRDFIPKPLTKADRIRAMSDEELAEFLETLCPSYNWTLALNGMTWFGFLQQEASE